MTTATRKWELETLRLKALAAVDNVCIAWLRHESAPPHRMGETWKALLDARRELSNFDPDMGWKMDQAINHHEYGGPLGYRARCYNAPDTIGESWLSRE
ncbi:hypothetical protein ACKFRT_04235 [Corynebacterium sp. YSMAA1_1_F7]|uniref:hypothetical protein n=1 Tax=Corynebacterium sp. YSMAA1_1_F7 TaxID=3383590 RepID=UPI0038D048D1